MTTGDQICPCCHQWAVLCTCKGEDMQLKVSELKGDTYTVILNGEDISNRCFAFDSIEGWADCYQTDNKGKIILQENDLLTERLHGSICFHKNQRDDENNRKIHSAWVREFFRVKREENE